MIQIMPVMSRRTAPPYGHRKGWVPRTQDVSDKLITLVHIKRP